MQKKIHSFFKSFGYAFEGVGKGFHERNMKVHGVATVLVFIAGLFFSINNTEWALLFFATGMVWVAELFNTALEEIADTLRDEMKLDYKATKHPRDLAAAAVLIASVVAVLIGMVVFLPYLM